MTDEIYFSVTGRNEGGKLVPFFGEVRVGHESVTVFGEAEGLDNKLRAVLAAMHLANALGIAAFDIPAILEACVGDKSSAEGMLRPFEDYRPPADERIKTAQASFLDPTPDRMKGIPQRLRQGGATSGSPCGEVESCRQGGLDDV